MFKKLTHPLTLFRTKSLNTISSPPEYITKVHQLKSLRKWTSYRGTQSSAYKLMRAKIVLHYKDKTCICLLDGNSPINTISESLFNELLDYEKSLSSCYINFRLEHVDFTERFYIGNTTVLGKPFIQKHVHSMDFDRRIIILNDMVRLDIFNEVPSNIISICIENMHFLALVDLQRKTSFISVEILEKMYKHDTTQIRLNFSCQLLTDIDDYSFHHDFTVIDNSHKYVILGLDFMKQHTSRIGKNYIQLKNGLRVHYLKK
jgi:hypothetical protein